MSSSVFFRFKSQKEPSRVAFDGTGISVFELKREIITMNKLGDGTEFELVVSSDDNNEVYDDDTSIIPRSTTVIAKRLPPVRPGKGGAARYVSGKMPQNAKNSHRSEAPVAQQNSSNPANGLTPMNGAQTEEQRVAAMFKMGADQWAQQQQQMANATPVHRSGPNKGKPANVPDHLPPPGYICYRCGEKGHWIQICPTNDDPTFENRPRVKRTTGIPRSFLKTIEKPTALANDGTVDDSKQPAGVMVNAEGEWVIAEPDKAAWDQYQAKAKSSVAAQEAAKQGSKELQHRGLECSIDNRLFMEPTKTPCCHTTFCRECITNALLEYDLRCPECSSPNLIIDNLEPDQEMIAKIRSYEEELATVQPKIEKPKSPTGAGQRQATKTPSTNDQLTKSPKKYSMTNGNPRKRSAESELVNERKATCPTEPAEQKMHVDDTKSDSQKQTQVAAPNTPASQQIPYLDSTHLMPQEMNSTVFPTMNSFMQMPMSMTPAMGISSAFHNPMMMPNGFVGNDWSHMWGGGFLQQPMSTQGGGFQNGMMPIGPYNHHSNFMSLNGTNGRSINSQGRGSFANQQRTTFSAPSMNDEDSAYFRKPVNPHRHQAKRNVQRPTDYREI